MLDPILKVTVLLALVALAAHQMRRSSAALRHMLWNFAIIAMVLIPVLTAVVPMRLRILPADASATEHPLVAAWRALWQRAA